VARNLQRCKHWIIHNALINSERRKQKERYGRSVYKQDLFEVVSVDSCTEITHQKDTNSYWQLSATLDSQLPSPQRGKEHDPEARHWKLPCLRRTPFIWENHWVRYGLRQWVIKRYTNNCVSTILTKSRQSSSGGRTISEYIDTAIGMFYYQEVLTSAPGIRMSAIMYSCLPVLNQLLTTGIHLWLL
jgi:hypothetical protein